MLSKNTRDGNSMIYFFESLADFKSQRDMFNSFSEFSFFRLSDLSESVNFTRTSNELFNHKKGFYLVRLNCIGRREIPYFIFFGLEGNFICLGINQFLYGPNMLTPNIQIAAELLELEKNELTQQNRRVA